MSEAQRAQPPNVSTGRRGGLERTRRGRNPSSVMAVGRRQETLAGGRLATTALRAYEGNDLARTPVRTGISMQVSHGASLRTECPPRGLPLGVNPPRPYPWTRGEPRVACCEGSMLLLRRSARIDGKPRRVSVEASKTSGNCAPTSPTPPGVRTDPDCPGPSWHSSSCRPGVGAEDGRSLPGLPLC
jgi:hypothetical protein